VTLWILLPAFNEAVSLPRLLPRIQAACQDAGLVWRAIILDDGSSDETANVAASLARDYPLDCLMHKINRGLGETERDLFEYVAEHAAPDDIALRLDCDDTHDPAFFLSMVKKLGTDYDVIVASRFQPGGGQDGVHGYRLLLTIAASWYMRLLFPIKGVRDYSCGFRAYRVRVLRDAISMFGNNFLQMKGIGFVSTLETIVKLDLLGARFAEVPFHLHYARKASPSKMVSSITTFGYLVMTVLHWWPFGGWRSFYKKLSATYRRSPEEAFERFGQGSRKRPMFSRIGGGGG
jgi:dolichol-phosphate mannosyltransferase